MRHGFSLVELSIVLVILGLLTGGILAGQSLIRASELRAVSSEFGRYVTAMQSFRDKYFALPGDMSNATKFWGTATNCPGTDTQGSSVVTCDGDGNGNITDSANSKEPFRAWQHLANAGLIEGSYDGVSSDSVQSWSPSRTNSPASKIDGNGVWTVYHGDNSAGSFSGNFFAVNYRNFFLLGGAYPGLWPANSVLKPEEAWNIDTKMDDGIPGRGKVIGVYYTYDQGLNCTTAANSSDFASTYKLDQGGKTCGLIFSNAI